MGNIEKKEPNYNAKFTNTDLYYVVKNSEEQYSLWPIGKSVPQGWFSVNVPMTRKSCIDYIEKNWKDMRPASLRKKLGVST